MWFLPSQSSHTSSLGFRPAINSPLSPSIILIVRASMTALLLLLLSWPSRDDAGDFSFLPLQFFTKRFPMPVIGAEWCSYQTVSPLMEYSVLGSGIYTITDCTYPSELSIQSHSTTLVYSNVTILIQRTVAPSVRIGDSSGLVLIGVSRITITNCSGYSSPNTPNQQEGLTIIIGVVLINSELHIAHSILGVVEAVKIEMTSRSALVVSNCTAAAFQTTKPMIFSSSRLAISQSQFAGFESNPSYFVVNFNFSLFSASTFSFVEGAIGSTARRAKLVSITGIGASGSSFAFVDSLFNNRGLSQQPPRPFLDEAFSFHIANSAFSFDSSNTIVGCNDTLFRVNLTSPRGAPAIAIDGADLGAFILDITGGSDGVAQVLSDDDGGDGSPTVLFRESCVNSLAIIRFPPYSKGFGMIVDASTFMETLFFENSSVVISPLLLGGSAFVIAESFFDLIHSTFWQNINFNNVRISGDFVLQDSTVNSAASSVVVNGGYDVGVLRLPLMQPNASTATRVVIRANVFSTGLAVGSAGNGWALVAGGATNISITANHFRVDPNNSVGLIQLNFTVESGIGFFRFDEYNALSHGSRSTVSLSVAAAFIGSHALFAVFGNFGDIRNVSISCRLCKDAVIKVLNSKILGSAVMSLHTCHSADILLNRTSITGFLYVSALAFLYSKFVTDTVEVGVNVGFSSDSMDQGLSGVRFSFVNCTFRVDSSAAVLASGGGWVNYPIESNGADGASPAYFALSLAHDSSLLMQGTRIDGPFILGGAHSAGAKIWFTSCSFGRQPTSLFSAAGSALHLLASFDDCELKFMQCTFIAPIGRFALENSHPTLSIRDLRLVVEDCEFIARCFIVAGATAVPKGGFYWTRAMNGNLGSVDVRRNMFVLDSNRDSFFVFYLFVNGSRVSVSPDNECSPFSGDAGRVRVEFLGAVSPASVIDFSGFRRIGSFAVVFAPVGGGGAENTTQASVGSSHSITLRNVEVQTVDITLSTANARTSVLLSNISGTPHSAWNSSDASSIVLQTAATLTIGGYESTVVLVKSRLLSVSLVKDTPNTYIRIEECIIISSLGNVPSLTFAGGPGGTLVLFKNAITHAAGKSAIRFSVSTGSPSTDQAPPTYVSFVRNHFATSGGSVSSGSMSLIDGVMPIGSTSVLELLGNEWGGGTIAIPPLGTCVILHNNFYSGAVFVLASPYYTYFSQSSVAACNAVYPRYGPDMPPFTVMASRDWASIIDRNLTMLNGEGALQIGSITPQACDFLAPLVVPRCLAAWPRSDDDFDGPSSPRRTSVISERPTPCTDGEADRAVSATWTRVVTWPLTSTHTPMPRETQSSTPSAWARSQSAAVSPTVSAIVDDAVEATHTVSLPIVTTSPNTLEPTTIATNASHSATTANMPIPTPSPMTTTAADNTSTAVITTVPITTPPDTTAPPTTTTSPTETTTAPNTTSAQFVPIPPPPSLGDVGEPAGQTIGGTSVLISLVGDPVTLTQLDAVASILEMAICSDAVLTLAEANRTYDVSNNPLHLFLGDEEGAADRGTLVTCYLIVALAFAGLLALNVVKMRRAGGGSRTDITTPPAAGLFAAFPSIMLLPMSFVMRLLMRSGVRLALFSSSAGDVAFGAISIVFAAGYLLHMFAALTVFRPRGLACVDAAPPSGLLAWWHQRIESWVGPSCVWQAAVGGGGACDREKPPVASNAGGDDGGVLVLEEDPLLFPPSPASAPQTHSAASPPHPNPLGEDDRGAATTAVHQWLSRHEHYVTKARGAAWYGALQLTVSAVLKVLSSAATRTSCLGRNMASIVVVLAYLATLLAMRPFPLPSRAKWLLCVVSNALLLVCCALNTANAALGGGGGIAGFDDGDHSLYNSSLYNPDPNKNNNNNNANDKSNTALTDAVAAISLLITFFSFVGTGLVALRIFANNFPKLLGTVAAVTVPVGTDTSVADDSRVGGGGGAAAATLMMAFDFGVGGGGVELEMGAVARQARPVAALHHQPQHSLLLVPLLEEVVGEGDSEMLSAESDAGTEEEGEGADDDFSHGEDDCSLRHSDLQHHVYGRGGSGSGLTAEEMAAVGEVLDSFALWEERRVVLTKPQKT